MSDYRHDSGIEHLRVPPQAIQAEQAVLGGMMLSADAYTRVADVLDPDDFYRRDHQLIYRAIRELADKSKPFDAVTLGEWFESQGMSELVGNGAYLVELASTTPSAANIAAYAEIVRDKATLRRLIDTGTEAVNAGFSPDGRTSEEILADLSRKVGELQPKQRGGLTHIRPVMKRWLDTMEKRFQQKQRITGLPTPYTEITNATAGLQPATLYFVGARPSMGKSVFANGIAGCAALRGVTTALFSLEASVEGVMDRLAANLGNVPYNWIKTPGAIEGIDPHDEDLYWSRIETTTRDLKSSPLYIDDTAGLNVRQFEARARRLNHQEKLGLIVVDHIHDFTINPDRARFEYGAIVQCGKKLAKEWNIPVVMFGQLNRNLAQRTDKRPNMADLRESGEIEQKADVIILLHREDYYDPDTSMKGVLEAIFAKGRDLQVGTKYLRHQFSKMRIEDWIGEVPFPSKQRDSAPAASRYSKMTNSPKDKYLD
jgi:replicative DNA helicase